MLGTVLGVLAAVYALAALVAWTASERIIFQPPRASYGAVEGDPPGQSADRANGGEAVPFRRIAVGNGDSLALVYLPAAPDGVTLLYSHGNAEDLGQVYPWLEVLHDYGLGVVAYDYRGYGRSSGGPPTVAKAIEDEETVYRYALHELGIPPERLVLHGRSVGSGPAVALAAREPIGGLVLESGFTSAFRVVTQVPVLPFDRFPNERLLRQVKAPVLVIHGSSDGVIPWAHGRRLYAAAPGPKDSLWVRGAGHNDVMSVAGERYVRALLSFEKRLLEGGD